MLTMEILRKAIKRALADEGLLPSCHVNEAAKRLGMALAMPEQYLIAGMSFLMI